LGVATLLRTLPWLFDVVRFAGAAYLTWLGVQVLRHGAGYAETEGGQEAPPASWSAFRRGLLTNILNPKALLFCSVLLPQFVHPDHGAVAVRLMTLGVILLTMGLGFDLFYGLTGQGAGRWMRARPMARRVQSGVFASILMLFGVRLLLTSRP
jgi:threonine/homoserine/homoserine lactone efflux protein